MIALPQMDFRRTPATLVLAGVIVAIEVVCTIRPEARVNYYNNYFGLLAYVWDGQPWRPFTSSLMHGGILHAAFNTYWLLFFGAALEPRFGSAKFLGLVVLLGYMSMMPQYVIGSYSLEKPVMLVGFSGVVYGLFGIMQVGRKFRPELQYYCDDQVVSLLIAWFFICLALTWAGIFNVANIAHGAGWFFGFVYGQALFNQKQRPIWLAAAILGTVVVLATLIACPGHAAYEQVKLLQHFRAGR